MRPVLCLLTAVTLGCSLGAATIDVSSFTPGATLIDFNNVDGGNCHLCGTSISTEYASLGVTFNNPSYPGMDTVQTNLTFGIPGATGPNALYVAQGGHIGDPAAAPFEIDFSIPVTMVGFAYGSSADSFLRVDVYGMNNTMLESLVFVGDPCPIGSGGFAGVEESSAITRLELSYHPNADPNRTYNFSIDNLQFQGDPPEPSITANPEPSTLALLALGILVIGIARRHAFRRSPGIHL